MPERKNGLDEAPENRAENRPMNRRGSTVVNQRFEDSTRI